MQPGDLCHCGPQRVGGDAMTRSGILHVGRIRRLMIAKQDGDASLALASDQSHLDGRIIRLNGDDRGKTAFRKIDAFDPRPGFSRSSRNGRSTAWRCGRSASKSFGARRASKRFCRGLGAMSLSLTGESRRRSPSHSRPGDRGEWCDWVTPLAARKIQPDTIG